MKPLLLVATMLLVLVAALTFVYSQTISSGPMNGAPIDASQCKVVPNQTTLCFALDGVHVSLAGAPFGPPLPVSGPAGPAGPVGPQGIQGIQGPPGVIVGSKLTGTLDCNAAGCTFTVTSIQ